MKKLLLVLALIFAPSLAFAAVGTVFVQTTGCNTGSATQCSGTTDSATASASGAGSTITCSATSGVGGTVPGCIITGTGSAVGQLGSIAVDGSQAVFVNCATNTNQKIFWITAVDNATGAISTISTIGTPITPTGCTAATSDWGIGGRYIYPSAATHDLVVNALRAGDTLQFNDTPAGKTLAYVNGSTSGDAVNGRINVIGKAGVSGITLANTGATIVPISLGSVNAWYIGNLTLTTTANHELVTLTNSSVVENCVLTGNSTGTSQAGIISAANANAILKNHISALGGDGIVFQSSSLSGLAFGNYIHNTGVTGITVTGGAQSGIAIVNNIIANTGTRGIYFNGGSGLVNLPVAMGNTVFNSASSAFEASTSANGGFLFNNIFNPASSVAPVTLATPAAGSQVFHEYNVYYSATSTANSNLTPGATEPTTNPVFTNTGTGDFSIAKSGSAANAGYPGIFPGATSTGYRDIGAVQRNASAGGGGGFIIGN